MYGVGQGLLYNCGYLGLLDSSNVYFICYVVGFLYYIDISCFRSSFVEGIVYVDTSDLVSQLFVQRIPKR